MPNAPVPPFHQFGPDHIWMLALVAVLAWLVARLSPSLGERTRVWIGRALALFLLGYAVSFYAITVTTRGFYWDWGLPLNVCDIVLVGSLAALVLRSPFGFEIAYFWGLVGTLQGLLTPDLISGFPTFRYFHFFWGHAGIIIAVVWMIAAERLYPRPGSVLRMFLTLNAYVVVIGLLDWAFGWNYAYLRYPPGHRSLLSLMGPWPWYLLWCEGIALAGFFLLDLPWRSRRAKEAGRGPEAGD